MENDVTKQDTNDQHVVEDDTELTEPAPDDLVEAPDGPAMKRVCVDGPVFDARQVYPT